MIGLEISYNGTILRGAQPLGVTLIIHEKNGKYLINFVGVDSDMFINKWIDAKIDFGDEIIVTVKDIIECSLPIQKFHLNEIKDIPLSEEDIKTMHEEQLKYFRSLEKILKEEQLI